MEMAKRKGQQTARVIVNVTPEQHAAVHDALSMVNTPSKNDVLLDLLKFLCESYGIPWPEHVKQQGARNDLKHTP
jgi:hypothetical protein